MSAVVNLKRLCILPLFEIRRNPTRFVRLRRNVCNIVPKNVPSKKQKWKLENVFSSIYDTSYIASERAGGMSFKGSSNIPFAGDQLILDRQIRRLFTTLGVARVSRET